MSKHDAEIARQRRAEQRAKQGKAAGRYNPRWLDEEILRERRLLEEARSRRSS